MNYFTHHVESIIQWLFLFILALSGFLISRGLLIKKSEADPGASAGGFSPGVSGAATAVGAGAAVGVGAEIEVALKQILERTQKLETVTVQGGLTPEAAALAETQVQALKKELSARDEELKTLKSTGAGAGTAKATEEAGELAKRLKELESKLAEYEILEDDIADLSLYKEENSRLRAELNKLKGGAPEVGAPAPPAEAPAEAAPAAASPAPTAATPPPPADDIVAEFAQAVSAEAPPSAVPAPSEVLLQVPDTGDPMKDFEAAVNIEKQAQKAAGPPPAAAPPPVLAPADGTKPQTAAGGATDLFAEFAEPPAAAPATVDESALDTDKMMAEMAALVNLEPATASSLDEGIDTEKMAAEAGSLQKR